MIDMMMDVCVRRRMRMFRNYFELEHNYSSMEKVRWECIKRTELNEDVHGIIMISNARVPFKEGTSGGCTHAVDIISEVRLSKLFFFSKVSINKRTGKSLFCSRLDRHVYTGRAGFMQVGVLVER